MIIFQLPLTSRLVHRNVRAVFNIRALASHAPILTLERAVGPAKGTDNDLRQTGAFAAEVIPDLPSAPEAEKKKEESILLPRAPSRYQQASWEGVEAETAPKAGADGSAGIVTVVTIANQLHSLHETRSRMIAAAAGSLPTELGSPRAGGLLLVSGSDPARPLAAKTNSSLANSRLSLSTANALKREGELPPGLHLWGVANPSIEERADIGEQKIECGATALLTQPPFDWPAFERWLTDADRRGVTAAARVLVGMPFISSPGNLKFWLKLANIPPTSSAMLTLGKLMKIEEEQGVVAVQRACEQYNFDMLKKLLAIPIIGGLHVMPLTPASKTMAMKAVATGGLLESYGRGGAETLRLISKGAPS